MKKRISTEIEDRRKFLKTGARYLALGGFTFLGLHLGTNSGAGDSGLPVSPPQACRDCVKKTACRKWAEAFKERPEEDFTRCSEVVKRKSNGKKR